MNRTISNSDDIIDSRQVIERIEELEAKRETLVTNLAETPDNPELLTLAEWDEGDDGAELAALKGLAEEASQYSSDWQHGEALIRDSYFETYAQELADDIEAVKSDANWPNNHIDWESAAEELQQEDYTTVDYDGVTYWIRSC